MREINNVIGCRYFKWGYWVVEQFHEDCNITMKSAYNTKGDYIGNPRDAYFLCKKKGIIPVKAKRTHNVCSIGFNPENKKWYGWSHRAINGFSIGDIVKKGDCCNEPGVTEEYLKKHPEADISLPVGFIAKTEEDCKRMAIAFAESVSQKSCQILHEAKGGGMNMVDRGAEMVVDGVSAIEARADSLRQKRSKELRAVAELDAR